MNTGFLRTVLAADIIASGASALIMILGSGLLAAQTGLPAGLLFWAGLILVPFVAFLAWTAMRPEIPRWSVQVIVELNLVWIIASFGLLALGAVTPNGFGVAFVCVQAMTVLGFALAQWGALRQPESAIG